MILLQASSVVVLNSALDRGFGDGVEEFLELSPNSRAYNDEWISQCSFMESEDADDFVQQLSLRGIDSPEAIIVHCANPELPADCKWLKLLKYNEHTIARHIDDQSKKLVAYEGFDLEKEPEIQHYTREEVEEKLEFVRREGSVDVYRDKETGQNLYVGRTTESMEEVYDESTKVIFKHFRNPGEPPAAESAHAEIREAIGGLQRVSAKNPEFWQAFFLLAKGWQALDEPQHAYDNLMKGYALAREEIDLLKELSGCCLELKKFEEGVRYAEAAVAVDPTSSELISNLSINHLMNGDGDAAMKSIQRALDLDSNDPINRNVVEIIRAVVNGDRPWPQTFAELTRRPKSPPRKVSWFKRLFGG